MVKIYENLRLINGEQISVDQLYVDVYILEKLAYNHSWSERVWEAIDKIANLLDPIDPCLDESSDRIGLGKRLQRRLGLEVCEEQKFSKLMILGQPGSGKTTFLRQLLVKSCKGEIFPNRIPVLIELRGINSKKFHLYEEICEQLHIEKAQIEKLLKSGKMLILLDGLDETTAQLQKTIQDNVGRFTKRYGDNCFIITCRLQTTRRLLDNFEYIEISDFDIKQIKQFIENWFNTPSTLISSRRITAEELIKKLQQNEPILNLAITPILLSLICWIANDYQDLPSKRTSLYERGLDLLMQTWDEHRGITRYSKSKIYHDLDNKERQQLLAYLSYQKFKEERRHALFRDVEFRQLATNYFAAYKNLKISEQEADEILRTISEQHGLLIERADKVWSFSHLSFQEYLAANWLCEKGFFQELAGYWMEHEKWKQVFQLAFEKPKVADPLFSAIKEFIDGLLVSDLKLQQFLEWVNEETRFFNAQYQSSSTRAYYSVIALSSILSENKTFPLLIKKNEANQQNNYKSKKTIAVMDVLYNSLSLALTFKLEPAFARKLSSKRFLISNSVGVKIFVYSLRLIFISILVYTALTRNMIFFLLFYILTLLSFLLSSRIIRSTANQSKWEDRLDRLLNQPPNTYKGELNAFQDWWKRHSMTWRIEIAELWNKQYSSFKHGRASWIFSDDQKNLLAKYYAANKLLIDYLSVNCNVSPEVRKTIENTLLLPAPKTKKRVR